MNATGSGMLSLFLLITPLLSSAHLLNRFTFIKNAMQLSSVPSLVKTAITTDQTKCVYDTTIQQQHNKVIFECDISESACVQLQSALCIAGRESVEMQHHFSLDEAPEIDLSIIMKSPTAALMWSISISSDVMDTAGTDDDYIHIHTA